MNYDCNEDKAGRGHKRVEIIRYHDTSLLRIHLLVYKAYKHLMKIFFIRIENEEK